MIGYMQMDSQETETKYFLAANRQAFQDIHDFIKTYTMMPWAVKLVSLCWK